MRSVHVLAGIPSLNNALYWRIRFLVGDPTAFVIVHDGGRVESTLIIRDIEMERARKHARADRVSCPADWTPAGGLSGDRETATAQALAECVRRMGATAVTCDRSFPAIYAHELARAGITCTCDPTLGVKERRSKDPQEIEWIAAAQQATESAMELACSMIARARAGADGVLVQDGAPLTAERVKREIDVHLLGLGYENPEPIVAPGPVGADCHDHGHGLIRTGEPVIVDIFPRSRSTRYNGDCTRTVVHGAVPPEVVRMHAAVVAAKAAATAATRAGVTGDAVHAATVAALAAHGYPWHAGGPPKDARADWCGLVHGTGHGLGLEVHEPPLLAPLGPELVVGDVLTIEPGLYQAGLGGIRVEDMVVVEAAGCRNLNRLHEGLDWR